MTGVTEHDSGGADRSSLPTVHRDPADPAFSADPWPFYAALHAGGGAARWADYDMVCLAGFDAVSRSLRDRRLARLPPPATGPVAYPPHLDAFARVERHSLLALEGPAHARLRKLVGRDFVGRRVARLAPGVEGLARERAAALGPGDDLLARYATPLPVALIARLIGVPEEESDDLLAWSHAMVRVYTMVQDEAEERAANAAAAAFETRLLALVAERRARPRDDLVSALVAREGDAAPTDAEIVSLAVLLLNAGHEATVHQIGNAVLTLLELPEPVRADALARLGAGGEARDRVVTELSRHRAPLHLFVRFAQEAHSPAPGVELARGERVALLLGAANRDPARFADPARFDPARADTASLAFGAGTHYCLGAHLARLEIATAVRVLFETLPGLALDGEPRAGHAYHFHGLESLPVRW